MVAAEGPKGGLTEVKRLKVVGCDVYLPEGGTPQGLVHFVPGALVSTAPYAFYGNLMQRLSEHGFAVVATPYETGFDHERIAQTVADKFVDAYREVLPRLPNRWLPTFGVGHSLGSKLHVLINSDPAIRKLIPPRASNILMSYNNMSAAESIPAYENLVASMQVLDRLSPILSELSSGLRGTQFANVDVQAIMRGLENFRGEIKPNAAEVERLLNTSYAVNENLVISFNNDTIDQSGTLENSLVARFEGGTLRRKLPGTHLTPMTPELGGVPRSLGLGEGIDNLIATQVGAVRNQYASEFDILANTIIAYLTLRTKDIETRILGPSKSAGAE